MYRFNGFDYELIGAWLSAISIIIVVIFWIGGGFSSFEGYTLSAGTAGMATPGANTYHCVIEVRKNGEDRVLFRTFDIDEALIILNEFKCVE